MKSILLLSLLFAVSILSVSQTKGDLEVSFTSSEVGGDYKPRHVIAVWVEDNFGNYVKTLLAYADVRMRHLNTWEASTAKAGSEYNVVDAITGATRYAHGLAECAWDGSNYQGIHVEDGVYKLYLELTDFNGTGNVSSFSFTKGSNAENLTPEDNPSFSGIKVSWTPESSFLQHKDHEQMMVWPNPTRGIIRIQNIDNSRLSVWDLNGRLIRETKGRSIDISHQASGIYLVRIQRDNATYFQQVIKE